MLRERLRELAREQVAVYRDVYYDRPDGSLREQGYELRVRVIESDGTRRSVLTFKEPAVDARSGSKPEHETTVGDPAVLETTLRALRAEPWVRLGKHCRNYRFRAHGREMLATLVEGTFVEVEAIVAAPEVGMALEEIETVLAGLGVTAEDLTTELYTDAVLDARSRDGAG
ncbi:class IV adenylate cyclase [Actinomadura terrae]|uniref:class IV adenylate cyclase n=1 Tax=Actinomadura terrae TaxID=604353 RepID=UPI001FA7645F|nr:class IV adenylate cyclase [Actinomadura terrae]